MKSLNILEFTKSDVEMLRFVVKNRKGQIVENIYDMIIGPVANDRNYVRRNGFFLFLIERYADQKQRYTADVIKEWDEKSIFQEIYDG